MRNVKSILGAAVALTVICAVVVAALAATNLLTADTIAAAQEQATNEACAAVLPDADHFARMEGEWQDGVIEVYSGTAENGDTLGYVVKTSTAGKSSGIIVMTGIAADGTVSGVQVIEDNETAGYIDTITKAGLLDKLTGISENVSEVDAVSTATKTSNGVKNGVALALAVVEEVSANG